MILRIALVGFLFFGSSGLLTAQTRQAPRPPSEREVRAKVLQLLETHPDRQAVSLLRAELEKGSIGLISAPLDLSSGGAQEHAAAVSLATYTLTKTLFVPDGFFLLSHCRQRIAVQAAGLMHARLQAANVEVARLLIAASFMDGAYRVKPDTATREELDRAINKLRPLLFADISRFAVVVFATCPPDELGTLWKNTVGPATDADAWSRALKGKIQALISKVQNALKAL